MAYKTSEGTWRVQRRVMVHGRYQRITRNFPTKALAERFEAEMKLKRYQPEDVAAADSKLTFGAFADRWLAEYCRVEKAASQWTEDDKVLRRYLKPMLGDVALGSLSRRHLVEVKGRLVTATSRNGSPLKPKTINNVLGLAKKMLATAVDWELLSANPFAGVRSLPMNEEPMAFWTAQERDFFIRFASKLDPEFTRLVTVASHTGLRRGELAGLQRYQLDFDKRLVQVSAAFCFKAERRVERTKNRALAFIPMNDACFAALKHTQLAAPSALVFGNEICQHASQRLRKLCAKVGARSIRFHDLRHTYASCLVMAGVPIFTVQQLMRHKTIAMTQRYAHLAPGYLREAADRLVTAAEPAAGSSEPGPDLSPELVIV